MYVPNPPPNPREQMSKLVPGQFVTDRGGVGRPRVEVIKILGGGLVQIRQRNARYTSVVSIDRLTKERPVYETGKPRKRNAESVYEPAGCNDPSWTYGGSGDSPMPSVPRAERRLYRGER
jgi:hypothetical protein